MMVRSNSELSRILGHVALIVALVLGGSTSGIAQDVQMVARPLTHQEIHDLGLTNTTQVSGGSWTVGKGMPVYLEVQIEQGVPASNVVWSLPVTPGGATAFETSPLDAVSADMYDAHQRQNFDLVERSMLRPDTVGKYSVVVQLDSANGTVAVTNQVTAGTYVGYNAPGFSCTTCHSGGAAADKITPWSGTGHATFLTRAIDGDVSSHYSEGCINCHTLGFDMDPGAVNGGFDDIAASLGYTFPTNLVAGNWDAMPAALKLKSNIQCESCHGPGSQHMDSGFGDKPLRQISVDISDGNCAQCHDEQPYHVKNTEWAQSLHATGAVFYLTYAGGSCKSCHSGAGFIKSVDPDYASKDVRATGQEGITCATCHDPHSAEGVHQARLVPEPVLLNGETVTAGGEGHLCMQCHKSRRDAEDYVTEWHDHYGPHHGPQADMLAGANAIEYGQTLDSSDAHLEMVEDSCVHCHMQSVADSFLVKDETYTNTVGNAGGHTFKMTWDGGTPTDPADDVHLTGACADCHGQMDSFDVGGHDYNGDGVVEGVQTEIGSLLEQLAMMLPPVGSNSVDTSSNAFYNATSSELKAAYNYLFVEEDGSHGVHNPKYAAGLLRASIVDMGGSVEPPVAPSHDSIRIASRPLTTQEVINHSLTNPAPAQLSGGLNVIALGAPGYLEAQALMNVPGLPRGTPAMPIIVTGTVWSVEGRPSGSVADLTDSVLGGGILMYDGGERSQYNLLGRKTLVPDVAGDYLVQIEVNGTTNGAPFSYVTSTKIIGAGYQGAAVCATCHDGSNQSDKMTSWAATAHSTFLTRAIDGDVSSYYSEGCISCHTVGFDSAPGAVNGGFDDVATALGYDFPTNLVAGNWDAMPQALKDKSNIQCENCHGPASQHTFGGADRIATSLSSGNCGQCHDAMPHHPHNYEWNQTLHATGYVYRVGCSPCHSSKDFIETFDPDYASKDVRATGLEGITCAACHDPHSDEGHYQLRVVPDVELGEASVTNAPYVYPVAVISEGGDGKLCMQCHKSRRTAEEYVTHTGSPYFGPHHGPQADMLAGVNAIDYGEALASSRHLASVEDSCVQCHMQDVLETRPDKDEVYTNMLNHAGQHVFSMSWDGGTPGSEGDDVDLVGTCLECHGPLDDFNFGGGDYDRDGVVEGVQKEIHDMLEELALLLPPIGSATVSVDSSYDAQQKKAVYNYLFVEEDGSHGVHNPKYAAGLLRASLTDMTTGLDDIDGDGVSDTWEKLHYGSITAKNGQSDGDNDGVPNSLEATLGTDPEHHDSDRDGYSDLVELEAGTDPMDINDVPQEGISKLYRALELVSGLGTGTNYQVQAIDSMGGTTWTNVGDVIEGAGQELQHFMTIRDRRQQYHRVNEAQ